MHQKSSRRNPLFLFKKIPWLSIILVGKDRSQNWTRKNQSNCHNNVAPQKTKKKKKKLATLRQNIQRIWWFFCLWYRNRCVLQILLWKLLLKPVMLHFANVWKRINNKKKHQWPLPAEEEMAANTEHRYLSSKSFRKRNFYKNTS